MATKCHKTGHYLIENMLGVLVYKVVKGRKVYSGECSRCGERHDLNWREVNAAMKQNLKDHMTTESKALLAELRDCRTNLDGEIMPDHAEPFGAECGMLRRAEEFIERARAQPVVDEAVVESRESRMVTLRRKPDGTPSVWCDPEIADLVQALNNGGVPTVASCSGHGEKFGTIALADGRELLIAPDFDSAKAARAALTAAHQKEG